MEPTTLDVLVKPADFERRATGLRLARWKWNVLSLVDGVRSIGAIASIAHVDLDLLFAFADECIDAELLSIEALTFEQFAGGSAIAAAPQPIALNAAPEPVATEHAPEPAATAVDPVETFDVQGVAIEMDPIGAELPATIAPPVVDEPAPIVVDPPTPLVADEDDAETVSIEIGEPEPVVTPVEVYATEIAPEPDIVPEPEPEIVPEPEPAVEPVAAETEPLPTEPVVAPTPPPPPAGDLPRTASLQERVAALKARALSAMQDASPKPAAPPDALEFSLSTPSKPTEAPASTDAIEFSL